MGRLLAVMHYDDVIAADTRAVGTRKLRPFHGRVMHHQPVYVIHVRHVTTALADLISLIDKGLLQNCVTHSLHKPLCALLCKGSKFAHLPPRQAASRCPQYTQQMLGFYQGNTCVSSLATQLKKWVWKRRELFSWLADHGAGNMLV